MAKQTEIKEGKFSIHRPVDQSDVGFTLAGKKLRWLSGAVEEKRVSRIWETIKMSELPAELQKHIVTKMPRLVKDGIIRRKDTVLAYASIEACDEEIARKKKEILSINSVLDEKSTLNRGDEAIKVETEGKGRFS